MNTSKVAKTPKSKTPNSAKKKGSAVKQQVDTPRPNLPPKKVASAKKQNGLKSAATPKSKNVTPKMTPKSNKKKPVVKKDEEDEEEEEDDDEEMDVDHIKELVMASDDDDDEEDDDDEGDDDDDDDDDDEDDDDDDDEIDEKDLEAMLKALRGKETKKVATPAKTPKAEKAQKKAVATPAKTPKAAAKGKDTGAKTPKDTAAKKADEAAPAKTPKAGKAKKTEAATPAKSPEKKAKIIEAASPAKKAAAAKKESTVKEGKTPDELQEVYEEQLKFFNDRNKRTLFVKRLPTKITEDEISKLSSDILVVRMRKSRDSSVYAFVEFKDEATAKKNFEVLKECKFDGTQIFVDYASTKSTSDGSKGKIGKLDPKKLYITGFPQKTTLEDLQKILPNAHVTLPVKSATNVPLGYAFVKFDTPELCSEALKQVQGKVVNGTPLIALYAKLVPVAKELKRKLDKPKGDPAAKKQKLKGEDDDDEEEEDDEDDDEEEEDDDDDDDDEEDDDEEEEEEEDDDDE